jgi:hypothetical protein
LTSLRTVSLLLLALLLALAGCAQIGETGAIAEYEFPVELLAADAAADAPATTTTTTAPRLSAEPATVTPPPPRAAVEALEGNGRPLPLPSSSLLPSVGRIEPSVITASGERRLLREVSVSVSYEPGRGFIVEPAGWWVINYPLERISGAAGRTADEVANALLGRPASDLSNYYFYTAPEPGAEVPEPPPATGPAPISVAPGPDIVVDNRNPGASDDNDGSAAHPLRTISAAVERATPGTVVHVYPGTYREAVTITADGTDAAPIQIQGIRGASGALPVITGNDPFPDGAWEPVEGLPGVYMADAFTGLAGALSVDGQALIQRSAPWELQPGEYVVTTGSDPYIAPRFDGDVRAEEGSVFAFGASQYIWERKQTDGGGFVDLGSEFGDDFAGGVFWGSAWVWVERPRSVADYEWFGSNDFDLQVSGPFRAGRISGVPLADQPYTYRVWLDGELLAGTAFDGGDGAEATTPHPEPGRGDFGETWHSVVMREGWHHLVFQWDTTNAAGSTATAPVFRFGIPEVIGTAITSGAKPASSRRAPRSGEAQPYVSEYMVLGPVPSSYEPSVYVRLPGDADPNDAALDLAARSGPVVEILGDFIEFSGFEVRHGAQLEGESLLAVGRRGDDPATDVFVEGVTVAGNLVVRSDYGGIGVVLEGDQGVAPVTIKNNWVIDAGAVGISAAGSSIRLTAATLNDWAPGRTRVAVTDNRIINSGWAGYDRLHDVAGIRFERMAGSAVMYNTIIGGGPGIRLAAESYAVRIDGNRIIAPWGFGIGVEANPGPNLVANNLITGLRAGPEWIKAHLLTWDSDQTWLINNTTDGEWGIETGWYGDIGSWGAGGPENFDRIEYDTWDLSLFRRVYLNNLLLGSFLGGIEDYQGNWGETDTFDSNFREVPSPDPFDYLEDGAEPVGVRRAFVARADGDYRLNPGSDLATAGAVNRTTQLATHDHHGLLRGIDETATVGAFRALVDVAPGSSVIEIELSDGTVARIDGYAQP